MFEIVWDKDEYTFHHCGVEYRVSRNASGEWDVHGKTPEGEWDWVGSGLTPSEAMRSFLSEVSGAEAI